MKAHADKAISDENREKIAPKQKSSLLKEIVTKATFAKLTTAPVVMTTEAPTTITTVSMTTTDVEVSRKTTLTSDGKKPWTFLKTLFKNYMFATSSSQLKKKPQKLFPSHYSIPLILWKCSFYTYFKTDTVYLLGFRASTKNEENQIAHGLLWVWTGSGGGCGGWSLGDLCEPVT